MHAYPLRAYEAGNEFIFTIEISVYAWEIALKFTELSKYSRSHAQLEPTAGEKNGSTFSPDLCFKDNNMYKAKKIHFQKCFDFTKQNF